LRIVSNKARLFLLSLRIGNYTKQTYQLTNEVIMPGLRSVFFLFSYTFVKAVCIYRSTSLTETATVVLKPKMGLYSFSLYLLLSFAVLENSRGQDFGTNLPRNERSINTDSGYGSRIQAGTDVVNDLDIFKSVVGQYGPGKRAVSLLEGYPMNTDFGYGSRLRAGENIAQIWDKLGLFGLHGPGKRNGENQLNDFGITKRITTDFGYGSRSHAAENAAKYLSQGELFGIQGPGKRNNGFVKLGESTEKDMSKRETTDYGYGARINAGENIAKAAATRDLYGIYGPGKRNTDYVKLGVGSDIFKRKTSDYGYGARIQVGENIAKAAANRGLYGVYGPGKRTDSTEGRLLLRYI
jgi:hypothetical protein